jgi:hypothetical protein
MSYSKKIHGRVLHVDKEKIYCARGHKIFLSIDNGKNWKEWASLPIPFWEKIIMSIPLLSRLFRKAIHHLVINEKLSLITVKNKSFIVENGKTSQIESLRGSRPMVFCQSKNGIILYGEYRPNIEKKPVHIWQLDVHYKRWEPVWQFNDVRHIHGVFQDPYTDDFWVTTGDEDSESGIWCTHDNFITLQKVVSGSQQVRAVQLLFSPDFIYFGSDAPEEKNYIYRMRRNGSDIKPLIEVGSSIFYGCKIGDSFFFSSAVEPSKINSTNYVEIWYSDNGTHWVKFMEFKKDIWSMKYFQYGQILFPSGRVENNCLYFTLFATKNSGTTFIINL